MAKIPQHINKIPKAFLGKNLYFFTPNKPK
jgi:hypothetical protein